MPLPAFDVHAEFDVPDLVRQLERDFAERFAAWRNRIPGKLHPAVAVADFHEPEVRYHGAGGVDLSPAAKLSTGGFQGGGLRLRF